MAAAIGPRAALLRPVSQGLYQLPAGCSSSNCGGRRQRARCRSMAAAVLMLLAEPDDKTVAVKRRQRGRRRSFNQGGRGVGNGQCMDGCALSLPAAAAAGECTVTELHGACLSRLDGDAATLPSNPSKSCVQHPVSLRSLQSAAHAQAVLILHPLPAVLHTN